jgi:hypothetical protein
VRPIRLKDEGPKAGQSDSDSFDWRISVREKTGNKDGESQEELRAKRQSRDEDEVYFPGRYLK